MIKCPGIKRLGVGRWRKYFVILFLVVCHTSRSAILNVPGAYASIQTAINTAQQGDTVLVAPGTYFENLNFLGKDITVSSHYLFNSDTGFISGTIIDGSQPVHPDTASCVLFIGGETTSAILQGFTLTGGKGTRWPDGHTGGFYREGGGILTENSSPTIRCNRIIQNEAIDRTNVISAGGGAIRSDNGNPQILNNVIENNRGRYGAGIVLNYTGAAILNNIIAHNTGGEDYGGSGIWINRPGPFPKLIENNTIADNASVLDGGGVLVWSTVATIHNNIIWGNSAPTGPQIRLRGTGSVDVSFSDVEGGWAGNANLDLAPHFACVGYYLAESSPCIDAGDFGQPDPPDLSDPENTDWPSRGSIRNDMGAYGGPGRALLGVPGDLLAPSLLTPDDGAVDQPQTMIFLWHPNTCGGPYHFQCGTDSTFTTNVLMDSIAVTETTLTLTGIPDKVLYYWRVESADTSLGNSWSPVRRFVVGGSLFHLEFDAGWNMISLPFAVEDPGVDAIFPPGHPPAFMFDGIAYQVEDSLQNGAGYWMNFPAQQPLTIVAATIADETVDVSVGWNLVGSISVPVAVGSIQSLPGGLVTSRFFGFSGSYHARDTLYPGQACWVKLNEGGKLVLSASHSNSAIAGRIRIAATDEVPPAAPDGKVSIHSYDETPSRYELGQNYPNPFNPTTILPFDIPPEGGSVSSPVTLKVSDVLGREIATLVNADLPSGIYHISWDAGGLPSGVYYYRLTAGAFTEIKRMLLMK